MKREHLDRIGSVKLGSWTLSSAPHLQLLKSFLKNHKICTNYLEKITSKHLRHYSNIKNQINNCANACALLPFDLVILEISKRLEFSIRYEG